MLNSIKKISSLLSNEKRKQVVALFFLLFIGMILEMLGIGLILPVLTMMINPDNLKSSILVKNHLFDVSSFSQKQLITGAMIIILVVYLIKSIFFWFLNKKQSKFIFGLSEDVSSKLFEGYLYLPFSFHTKYNSSYLLRNIQAEVIQFTYSIQSMMNLATESLLSLSVSLFLFIVEPIGTLIIFSILALVSLLTYKFTKVKLAKLGLDRQHHEGECNRHLLQGLNGIKEVKVLGKEDQFYDFFSVSNKERAVISAEQYAIQNSPKILLEFFSILGLVIIVFSVLFFSSTLDKLIPILGVFAAASFRLLPSINRLVGSAQLLRFTQSAIDTLYNEHEIIRENGITKKLPQKNHLEFRELIEVENLCFAYPESTVNALSNVSFKVPVGKSIGIIGESGSGKSTLVNIILGLLEQQSGDIKTDGKSTTDNIRSWQSLIGYVPQFIYLTDDSIKRNVAFGTPDIEVNETALMEALDMASLTSFVFICFVFCRL